MAWFRALVDRDMTQERISFLDGLRAFGMFMVVAVHALGRADFDQTVTGLLATVVGIVAVPPFFFADGFLFALKHGDQKVFAYKQ